MSKTRNNHYVPQWYQEGFFEPGSDKLVCLDMAPEQIVLADGRIVTKNARFRSPTSLCFRQFDLYTTVFGATVNDEIERRLFGSIDARGAKAVRAFAGTDVTEWHRHCQTLFEYIDIQKIRTPKGLDWLRAQYPSLSQNDLMREMQGIRSMHCRIWAEGVREIVSAEDADVKFIVGDHPVTIYNSAAPPDARGSAYPIDPSIALKGSQTIFPLNRDFCLVLTNLEYANNEDAAPLEKRTFARNYHNSLIRTDAFIRTRKLSAQEVAQINRIIKSRARRFVAAGREEWLYPEAAAADPWHELGRILRPPRDELWRFGGEMFVKYDDGHVHYQDAFGRSEAERKFLKKEDGPKPRARDACGCGSGKMFKLCCEPIRVELRPTWREASIRERNIMFRNAVVNVLGLEKASDWIQVRREITDEKISEIYNLFEGLWPLETDLLSLLPKPDGRERAVYTGSLHPELIEEFAFGAGLYFGEILVTHPFTHPGILSPELSPVKNPRSFRQEFLKDLSVFLDIMPLVEFGLINLVPDPTTFDAHLRDQMMHMARERLAGIEIDPKMDKRQREVTEGDFRRGMLMLPPEALKHRFQKDHPEANEAELESFLAEVLRLREDDPLAVLQEGSLGSGENGGQFQLMRLAPNFEITMYLAQATGASIVTDSMFRWLEILSAADPRQRGRHTGLPSFANEIEQSEFAFLSDPSDIARALYDGDFADYGSMMRSAAQYLVQIEQRGRKPNWEAHQAARFRQVHASVQAAIRKRGVRSNPGQVRVVCPPGGFTDHSVNRLLLMSSSEHHMAKVPLAFYIRRPA